jgi:3-isopropylmalate/(R)-2-methylmalate dehydratase large subunit
MTARTIIEKIWDAHTIMTDPGGQTLLHVDWLLCSEGSIHAFNVMRSGGFTVRKPRQVFGVADHYTPSGGTTLAEFADDERRNMVTTLERNMHDAGITLFGLNDPRRGIQHLVGPEQGLTQPGVIMLCGDSHTSTQGAVGALAFSIGGELAHALATQTLWQRKPKQMRITISGRRGFGVAAKDVILAIIGRIGIGGAAGHVIEYAGSTIAALSMEQRMTICNMSIEAGARIGMIGPDDTTYQFLAGRANAPKGAD